MDVRQPFLAGKTPTEARVTQLIANFRDCLKAFDEKPPFTLEQLNSHIATIALRKSFASAQSAARSERFALALRSTLLSWGIGKRGSNLVGPEEFAAALDIIAGELSVLENRSVDDPGLDVAGCTASIWALVERLDIVRNENKIVPCTKALHHVLPDLIPPIDREYTQTFFGWSNPEFQYHPKKCFSYGFSALARIARAVNPAQYVGADWRTSKSKILDNALVGFCRMHKLESSNRRYQRFKKERENDLIRRAKELGVYDQVEAEARKAADKLTNPNKLKT